MLRALVAVVVLSQVTLTQTVGQELRLRTVDLKGDPVEDIQVTIQGIRRESDANGIVTFPVSKLEDAGDFEILVNLQSEGSAEPVNEFYIGRAKEVSWDNADRFASGFVIPLWEWGDVNSLATAIVRNPNHYVVALQYDKQDVSSTRVIATYEGDAEAWIEQWAPDLPAVSAPHLARSLHASVVPGATVPEEFADEMAEVYREVERLNWAARICRQFPDRATPRPRDDRPGNGTDRESDDGARETGYDERQVTTYKTVWETEYREQRRVVRRPVTETVMKDENYTIYQPVTTYRTEYVDQGGYVDRVVCTPAEDCRGWLPWRGSRAANPEIASEVGHRLGSQYWRPIPTPGTCQVQRQYVPNVVPRHVPTTNYVPKVVTRQRPVQVTRYVEEVVTQKVPVRVRKTVPETQTIQVPRTSSNSVPKTSDRQMTSVSDLDAGSGWRSVNRRQ